MSTFLSGRGVPSIYARGINLCSPGALADQLQNCPHTILYKNHQCYWCSKTSLPALAMLPWQPILVLQLSHWGRDKMATFLQTTFSNENVWKSIKISLKFIPEGPNNNIPALVQIMARRRPGEEPFSEPMMVRSPTHVCITQPQWFN